MMSIEIRRVELSYDRVSWTFIEERLLSRGFGARWRGWMKKVIQGGSLCLRINDKNSVYFKPGKGRKGIPCPPSCST